MVFGRAEGGEKKDPIELMRRLAKVVAENRISI